MKTVRQRKARPGAEPDRAKTSAESLHQSPTSPLIGRVTLIYDDQDLARDRDAVQGFETWLHALLDTSCERYSSFEDFFVALQQQKELEIQGKSTLVLLVIDIRLPEIVNFALLQQRDRRPSSGHEGLDLYDALARYDARYRRIPTLFLTDFPEVAEIPVEKYRRQGRRVTTLAKADADLINLTQALRSLGFEVQEARPTVPDRLRTLYALSRVLGADIAEPYFRAVWGLSKDLPAGVVPQALETLALVSDDLRDRLRTIFEIVAQVVVLVGSEDPQPVREFLEDSGIFDGAESGRELLETGGLTDLRRLLARLQTVTGGGI